MKKNSVLFIFFTIAFVLNAQSKQDIKQLIDNKKIDISVSMAFPSQGKNIHLTSNYNVKISGDSIYADLPFFGRAYSAPYGGYGGIKINALYDNYIVSYKKKLYEIKFDVKTPEDFYKFSISIWENGKSDIKVSPQNRSFISYSGDLMVP